MADVDTVTCVLTLTAATPKAKTSLTLRSLDLAQDKQDLLDLYLIAFHGLPEFDGWPIDEMLRQAEADITQILTNLQPASRVAVDPDTEAIVGALLIDSSGKTLRHLMIDPEWQRRRLASALLHAAAVVLIDQGTTEIQSCYAATNHPSAAWHEAMGFVKSC